MVKGEREREREREREDKGAEGREIRRGERDEKGGEEENCEKGVFRRMANGEAQKGRKL